MAKKKHVKTNAVRILEKLGIEYRLKEYDVDENDLSGMTVAAKIGLPPRQVFKTLVARGVKKGIVMAAVPTDSELNLKALATAMEDKKVELVPVREIQKLTGYIRGGVSPVGTKKPYPVFLDESSLQWPFISLSAGVRGCQMLIDPRDLVKAVTVMVNSITK